MLMLFDETAWNFLDRHLAPCLLSLYSPDLSTCPPVHTSPLLSTYPCPPYHPVSVHPNPIIPPTYPNPAYSLSFPLSSAHAPFLPCLPSVHISNPPFPWQKTFVPNVAHTYKRQSLMMQRITPDDQLGWNRSWPSMRLPIRPLIKNQNPLSQTHSNTLLHSPLVSRPTRWSQWYLYLDVDHLSRNIVQRCATPPPPISDRGRVVRYLEKQIFGEHRLQLQPCFKHAAASGPYLVFQELMLVLSVLSEGASDISRKIHSFWPTQYPKEGRKIFTGTIYPYIQEYQPIFWEYSRLALPRSHQFPCLHRNWPLGRRWAPNIWHHHPHQKLLRCDNMTTLSGRENLKSTNTRW